MNDWYLEKMTESHQQAIRREVDQISLQELAGGERPKPWLFRLGSGLVAIGERLRRRNAARTRDYWAVQNEWKTQQR